MKRTEYLKIVLILPGNVLITIPLLIFYFTQKSHSYNFIGPSNFSFYVGIFCFILGLFLSIWSVRTFYNNGGKGTPAPWNPITNFIITGPYRYVRNPMILGVVFLLLSESIFFSSFTLLIWALFFFLGNVIYFKFIEERDLILRFGTEYENYRNEIPMFFPKFTPYNNK